MKKNITIINNGEIRENIQIDSHNTNNTPINISCINYAFVEKKLRENDVSEQQIDSIKPQIEGVVDEYNKEEPDRGKLHDLFAKIQKNGGNTLLNAFKFLTKTAVTEAIQCLIRGEIFRG